LLDQDWEVVVVAVMVGDDREIPWIRPHEKNAVARIEKKREEEREEEIARGS